MYLYTGEVKNEIIYYKNTFYPCIVNKANTTSQNN